MIRPLAVLILAHLVADFILQPASLIALKQKRNKPGSLWNSGVFWHSLVHLALSTALLVLGACGAGATCWQWFVFPRRIT